MIKRKVNPPKLFGSKILDTLTAIRKANLRDRVGRGRYRVFPTNSGEAFHPQKVRKHPK